MFYCLFTGPNKSIPEVTFHLFQLVFGSVVPTLIIAVSNIGIGITVRQASLERTKMSAQLGKDSEKRENQLTAMLVVVSIVYFVTTIPHKVYYVATEISAMGVLGSLGANYITTYIIYDIWMCNYAVNLYLYCLSGGNGYRRDARSIVKCLW